MTKIGHISSGCGGLADLYFFLTSLYLKLQSLIHPFHAFFTRSLQFHLPPNLLHFLPRFLTSLLTSSSSFSLAHINSKQNYTTENRAYVVFLPILVIEFLCGIFCIVCTLHYQSIDRPAGV